MPRKSIVGNPQRLDHPKHFSHSARDTLLRCAKSYFLSRMTPAPKQPALWLATGSAVHEVTEAYDRSVIEPPQVFDVEALWGIHFGHQLDKLRRADSNEFHWRSSKGETIDWWNVHGPQMVSAYIAWRKRAPYEIWTTPDGVAAVELDVSGHLPGCEVEIKAYVDVVFHDPVFDQLIVVDKKTSKRPPASADQMATYGALIAAKWPEVVPALGVAFMLRPGTLASPWPLLAYTPETVGEMYQKAWEQIKAGEFTANPGAACRICDVSSSCAAIGGPLAHIYDPSHEAYEHPPF